MGILVKINRELRMLLHEPRPTLRELAMSWALIVLAWSGAASGIACALLMLRRLWT